MSRITFHQNQVADLSIYSLTGPSGWHLGPVIRGECSARYLPCIELKLGLGIHSC